jgi:hypothetical protein
MSAQNQAYAQARIENFAGQFPSYRNVAEILLGAIEGGSDAVGQAITVLIRLAEGFALLYQKRIPFDVTLQLRKREAEVIGLLVAGAIAEADVSHTLEGARDLVEQLEAAERTRAAAQEKREADQAEQKIRLQAEQMSVGEIMKELDDAGLHLSLEGEKIIARGANLNLRHKLILNARRRDVTDAIRGREHATVI